MSYSHPHTPAFVARVRGWARKHALAVAKVCAGGSLGFDPERDERTKSKSLLADWILSQWIESKLVDAHEQVVATYSTDGAQSRRKGRRRAAIGDAMRSGAAIGAAILEDEQRALMRASMADNNMVLLQKAADQLQAERLQQIEQASAVIGRQAVNESKKDASTAAAQAGQQIADLLANLAGQSVDREEIEAIVEASIAKHVSAALADVGKAMDLAITNALGAAGIGATVVKLQIQEQEPINCGIQHAKFPLLLKACHAKLRNGKRLNIMLVGPAGSGKTTAAMTVAKLLNLPFRTNGALDQAYKVSGYLSATDVYRQTAFRDAWEHGGVYLFDEMDGSFASALLELNTALANTHMTFPDRAEPVERHDDCIIIAGTNTWGLGASTEYNSRQKLDAASLDRFVGIEWPIDERLERAMAGDQSWARRVQSIRARVVARGVKGALITPRATVYGESLIAAGIDLDTVEAMTLRKGMDNASWEAVK